MIMYTVAEDHMGDTEIAQVYPGYVSFLCGSVEVVMNILRNDQLFMYNSSPNYLSMQDSFMNVLRVFCETF